MIFVIISIHVLLLLVLFVVILLFVVFIVIVIGFILTMTQHLPLREGPNATKRRHVLGSLCVEPLSFGDATGCLLHLRQLGALLLLFGRSILTSAVDQTDVHYGRGG